MCLKLVPDLKFGEVHSYAAIRRKGITIIVKNLVNCNFFSGFLASILRIISKILNFVCIK